MRYFICIFLVLFSLDIFSSSMWSKTALLGKRVCSEDQDLCAKVTVDYDRRNSKLLMSGRVKRVKRAGRATLVIEAYRGDSLVQTIDIDFNVNGKWSQIIKAQSDKLYKIDSDVRFSFRKLSF